MPEVIPELTTKRVLATELIQGVPLDKVRELDQETKNRVCFLIIMYSIFENAQRCSDFEKLWDPRKMLPGNSSSSCEAPGNIVIFLCFEMLWAIEVQTGY